MVICLKDEGKAVDIVYVDLSKHTASSWRNWLLMAWMDVHFAG